MKALAAATLLASSVLSPGFAADPAPAWLRIGPHTTYDGQSDDLVIGGLGAEAMLGGRRPTNLYLSKKKGPFQAWFKSGLHAKRGIPWLARLWQLSV